MKLTWHLLLYFYVNCMYACKSDLLVKTPPQTGPTMPMRRMAIGMNLAILCWCRVARESSAAGR